MRKTFCAPSPPLVAYLPHDPYLAQVGTVTDQAQTDWLRYFSLSNAGYEPDGNKKTNQDAFISYGDFGLCQPPPCNLEPSLTNSRVYLQCPARPKLGIQI
jgi:hypothetical protein